MVSTAGLACRPRDTPKPASPEPVTQPASAPEDSPPDFLLESQPHTEVLLLGVFHFAYPGLDSHVATDRVDVMSPKRQAELVDVVDRLAQRYAPTQIAVEWPAARQGELDRHLEEVTGEDLSANEIDQIGVRLAKRLSLSRLHAIDAPRRYYEPEMTDEQFDQRLEALGAQDLDAQWYERFEQLYDYGDRRRLHQTMRQALLDMNDPENIRRDHGAYLIGLFKAGRGMDYLGADHTTSWYNRNLRIFANMQRIGASARDRILVVIGTGHLALVRHCVQCSPEYRLVEVADVLG